jgi:hypothetical protein
LKGRQNDRNGFDQEASGCDLLRPDERHLVGRRSPGHDLIGIGSGIYAGKYHRSMFRLIEKIPRLERDVFLFSTAGGPDEKYEQPIRELLIGKGARIVGEFRCPGQAGFLGFIWTNKGHPYEKDLENARAFAKGLLSG